MIFLKIINHNHNHNHNLSCDLVDFSISIISYYSINIILLMFRDWSENPETTSIQRVDLSELDFPAITVCPDSSTNALAIRTIYNMYYN